MLWCEYFIFVCFRNVATSLFDRNKTVFEILLKDMAMKSLDSQLKLMALVMVYVKICEGANVTIYYNKHRHSESCSRWDYSYSGTYCGSNIKSGNETYASHLIFKQ